MTKRINIMKLIVDDVNTLYSNLNGSKIITMLRIKLILLVFWSSFLERILILTMTNSCRISE